MDTGHLLERGSYHAKRGPGDTTDEVPPADRSSGTGAPKAPSARRIQNAKLPPAADARSSGEAEGEQPQAEWGDGDPWKGLSYHEYLLAQKKKSRGTV